MTFDSKVKYNLTLEVGTNPKTRNRPRAAGRLGWRTLLRRTRSVKHLGRAVEVQNVMLDALLLSKLHNPPE